VDLFASDVDLDSPARIGQTAAGEAVLDPQARNRDIPDIVANPNLAHFFNTDCASCHTETTRSRTLGVSPGPFAFTLPPGVSRLSDEVRPADRWNVRNFGWGLTRNGFRPAATVRTANETAEVVEFINRVVIGKHGGD
jgi:hypothetical protein